MFVLAVTTILRGHLWLTYRSSHCAGLCWPYCLCLRPILLVYGANGFSGKDYDMPIAVLSSLMLGVAIDFAIHFIQRYRQLS